MKKIVSIVISVIFAFTLILSTACSSKSVLMPQLRISETTNEWEVSYDEGKSWTSLGVKATGEKGDKGDTGATGPQGAQGVTPKLRINENTNEWEVSYNEGKTWTSLGVKATGTQGSSGNNGSGDNQEQPDKQPETAEFVPVTRFAVTSDVHLRENGAYESQDRLEAVLDTAYGYAESQTDYNKLDAFFFVGDQTQNGSEVEQTTFFNTVTQKLKGDTIARAVMGNHEYYATGHYSSESMIQGPLNFMEFSGYEDDDAHLVIDGYHYIFASLDKYRGNTGKENEFLSPTKIAWLKGELDKALADDETGEKPIFVFQHVHASNTVIGSSGRNGDIALKDLLDDYPNVVDFSGHTHYSLVDPRSIWQGEFTAFNTGSMSYLALDMAGRGGYYNELNENGDLTTTSTETGYRNGNMYYICEISADNQMRVHRYDAIRDEVYGEPYYLDSFGDSSGFDYTSARKELSVAPVFSVNDKINFSFVNDKKIEFSFPQATCKDIVNNYRIELYSGQTLITTDYKLSRAFLGGGMPNNISLTFAGLEQNTEYTIKVFPVNSYAVEGLPLVGAVTTLEKVVLDFSPDIFSIQFNDDGSAIDAVSKTILAKHDSPTVTYDTELGKNIASFDGSNDAYTYDGISDYYTQIGQSFSLEMYVYLNTDNPKYAQSPVSNLQSGGFGFEYQNDKMEFLHYQNSAYARVDTTVTSKTWVHIVGVFDGSSLKVYLNGTMVATVSATGTFKVPQEGSQFLGIGADSGASGTVNSFFNGKIATINIYSQVLTAQQVDMLSRYNSK